jgi:hypothetical protein
MFKKSSDLRSAECLTYLKTISNKGKFDIEQHLQSASHKDHAKSASASRHLRSFLVTNKDPAKVSAAEAVFAFHTVMHNTSFRFSDCNSKLINKVFNDSAAGKKFSSCPTKTEAIIKNFLAPHARETVSVQLKNVSYVGILILKLKKSTFEKKIAWGFIVNFIILFSPLSTSLVSLCVKIKIKWGNKIIVNSTTG